MLTDVVYPEVTLLDVMWGQKKKEKLSYQLCLPTKEIESENLTLVILIDISDLLLQSRRYHRQCN